MGGGGGGFGGQQNWDFKSNIDPEELFRTIFGNKAGVYILKNYSLINTTFFFIKEAFSVCVFAEKLLFDI